MQALKPEVLIPGHGPVIFGGERAAQMLDDGAAVLESLTRQTLELMNKGSSLERPLPVKDFGITNQTVGSLCEAFGGRLHERLFKTGCFENLSNV